MVSQMSNLTLEHRDRWLDQANQSLYLLVNFLCSLHLAILGRGAEVESTDLVTAAFSSAVWFNYKGKRIWKKNQTFDQ